MFYRISSPSGPLPKNSWRTKIVKGAKILGSVAKSEASGVKIGPLKPGVRALGPILENPGSKLVALGSKFEAMGSKSEALRQRFKAPGLIVGALGSRFGCSLAYVGGPGPRIRALEP